MENLNQIIPFLIPIIILQLLLIVVALRDLINRERTNGPKWMWVLVILFGEIFGPIIYLLVGRED
jgi:hypothetical protein